MLGVGVGSGQHQLALAGDGAGGGEHVAARFGRDAAVDDEHGVVAFHDADVGHQRNAFVGHEPDAVGEAARKPGIHDGQRGLGNKFGGWGGRCWLTHGE